MPPNQAQKQILRIENVTGLAVATRNSTIDAGCLCLERLV